METTCYLKQIIANLARRKELFMAVELKSRIPLYKILQIPINENIFVKVYDTTYGINIKIYQKHETQGTELFVNVDLDRIQIPGLKTDYEKAVYDYIRDNLHLTMTYDQGTIHYLIALRNYRK